MHAINSRGLALGSRKLQTEGEMATGLPITQQICSSVPPTSSATSAVPIAEVEDCLIYDRNGLRLTFKSLYQTHKAIIIFVRVFKPADPPLTEFFSTPFYVNSRDVCENCVKIPVVSKLLKAAHQHFLCYTCQEYVEDLSKIPQEMLLDADVRLIVIGQSGFSHIEAFCLLTGYQHEIYVDPERHIYKKLGMKRGEIYEETASQSPHVKSSMLVGSIKSMWRAMTSPAFDFQGDPLQQGGALIIGPGPNIHVAHFDMNRFNHMPINGLLQLAGIQVVDFNRHAKIIDV